MMQPSWFVGVDLGSQEHAVAIVGADGRRLRELAIPANPLGILQLLGVLGGAPGGVAVAVESPHNQLVEVLLDRQVPVWAINPKQLDRLRDRHTVAGSKNDRLDAYVLADSLRTDRPLFQPLAVDLPEVRALRELSRTLEELDKKRRQAANQLWQLLLGYFPGLLKLCSGADEPWLWELLRLAPTPRRAGALSPATLAPLLRRHRITRVTAADLQRCLAEAVTGLPAAAETVCGQHARRLVEQLVLFQAQLKEVTQQIEKTVPKPKPGEPADPSPPPAPAAAADSSPPPADEPAPDAEFRTICRLVASMKGIGPKTGATLIGEAYPALREGNYAALRGRCGVAPVTRQSGKKQVVLMRRACARRLRNAMHYAANVAVQQVPAWGSLYARIRSRGGSHSRALRQVADKMLKVLTAMIRTGTMFDLEKVKCRSTDFAGTTSAK